MDRNIIPESQRKSVSNVDVNFLAHIDKVRQSEFVEHLMHGHSHASSRLPSGARADCDTPERLREMRLDETYSRANGMLGSITVSIHVG